MKLLALDPGVTTGYALFEVHIGDKCLVDLQEWGNLCLEDFEYSLLPALNSLEPDLKVYMEKIPLPLSGKLNDSLRSVLEYLHRLFPHAIETQPGVWKYILNFPRAYPLMRPLLPFHLNHDHKPTSHQKDAYYLGIYHIIRDNFPKDLVFLGKSSGEE